MAVNYSPQFMSDNERGAKKHRALVLALRKCNEELDQFKSGNRVELEEILARFTPFFVNALEATGFFILATSPEGEAPFEVIKSSSSIKWESPFKDPFLTDLIRIGESHIFNEEDQHANDIFMRVGVKSAVIVPIKMTKKGYLIGICNKENAADYPFLAEDRHTLEYFANSMVIGRRSEEKYEVEQAAIQEINKSVSQGNQTSLLENVVQTAATLGGSKYAVIFTYEKAEKALVAQCAWNSEEKRFMDLAVSLPLNRKSLNATVVRNKSPEYIGNLANSHIETYQEKFEKDAQSAYCVPLISQTRLIGTLYVAHTEVDGISPEGRLAVDRLAANAAVAIDNTLLFERMQEEFKLDEEVINLHVATADVLQEKNQVEQVEKVLLDNHFSADQNLFIAFFDPTKLMIQLQIVYENGEKLKDLAKNPIYDPRKYGLKRGLLDYMYTRSQEVLDIPNFQEWEDRSQIDPEYRNGLRWFFAIALKIKDETIGWIGFRGYDNKNPIKAYQRLLIEKIAPHMAIVLVNARQYQSRVRELEAVSEFQKKVSNLNANQAQEVKQVSVEVHAALKMLGLDTSYMCIALFNEETDELTYPIVYINGKLITESQKQFDANYRTRPLSERRGFTEWIIQNEQPIFCPTRESIAKRQGGEIEIIPPYFKSWFGVPMVVAGKTLGVMAIRSTREEIFLSKSQMELLKTIGNQAAITIENARRYQEVILTSDRYSALYNASWAIKKLGVEMDQDDILKIIVEQAKSLTKSHLAMLYIKEGDDFKLSVADPPEYTTKLPSSLTLNSKGIVVAALRKGKAILVEDVGQNNDYIDVSNGLTKSQLAVVLLDNPQKWEPTGVLSVEHNKNSGLNKKDRDILIALANMATLAINNTKRAKELERNKLIALMGAWGADLIHDINREVARIRQKVFLINLEDSLTPSIRQRIEEIDEIAESMRPPDPPPTNLESGLFDISLATIVDEVIVAEIRHFKEISLNHQKINFHFEPTARPVYVRMHEQWIRRLLRHYLTNAQRYIQALDNPKILVRTHLDGEKIVVFVDDNGPGVREEIKNDLFDTPIEHDKSVSGRGLMLVKTICDMHGGDAWLNPNGKLPGASFAFSVPQYE